MYRVTSTIGTLLFVLVAAGFFRVAPSQARATATITELGRSGDGACQAVSANVGQVALGSGLSVELWNASDTAAPVRLGGIELAGVVIDVIHDGSTIYATVFDGVNGNTVFYALDFSTPAAPTVRDSISFVGENFGSGFVKAGSYYYLIVDGVCNIINLINPDNLLAAGTTRAGNHYATAAGRLFVATPSRLYVLDISTPTAPVELGSWLLSGNGFINALSVSADGNFVFVGSGGIHVVDASTPTAMSEVTFFNYGRFVGQMHREGNRIYTDDTNGTMSILDVSTPAAPALLGEFGYSGGQFRWLSGITTDPTRVAGAMVFAAIKDGVMLVDANTPATSARTSFIPTGGGATKLAFLDIPAAAKKAGADTYVVDASGSPAADLYKATFNPYVLDRSLAIAELFDPNVESLFGFADDDVGFNGAFAWLRRQGGIERTEIDVLTGGLKTTASVATTNPTEDIATNGNLIAAVQGPNPIEFFDTNLSPLANSLDPLGHALGAAFGANFFVTWSLFGDFQIRVYGTPDATGQTTQLVAFNTAIFEATDVTIFGNFLFIYNGSGGCLQIYEILNLNAVQFVGEICNPTSNAVRAVTVAPVTPAAKEGPGALGKRAAHAPLLYVAGSSNDLSVYDITDIANPQLLGSTQTKGLVSDLRFRNGVLFAAEGAAGFATYDIAISVPVVMQSFRARPISAGVELEWRLAIVDDEVTVDLTREEPRSGAVKTLVAGKPAQDALMRFVDTTAEAEREYRYTLVANLSDGSTIRSEPVSITTPTRRTELLGSFPNPFNPRTEIRFVVAKRELAELTILDVQGRLVRTLLDDTLAPGTHTIEWDGLDGAGRQVASGAYFLRLQTTSSVDSQKLVLLK